MSLRRQVIFWLTALIVFVAIVFFLRSILLPFVAGMLVGYFLDPLVDWVEARGASRTLATSLVTVLFFAIAIALSVVLFPTLQRQLIGLVGQLPEAAHWIEQSFDTPLVREVLSRLVGEEAGGVRAAAQGLAGNAIAWLGGVVSGIWSGGLALFNLLSLAFITPVIAFYLLRDYDRMVARVDGWLPRDHATTIREQLRLIDDAIAGFVRGQATVCIILGVFYAIALSLAGLNFGFAIGLIGGALAFIPYVGMILTLALSVGVAVVQFWPDPLPIVIVVAIFLAGQLIEGTFLTPKLVGDRIGLHPVWVIFALFAGGALAGFLGVLIAVPVAAIAGVVVRFLISRYLKSRYFVGAGGA